MTINQHAKDSQRKIIVAFIDWCQKRDIDLVGHFDCVAFVPEENLDPLIDKYQTFLDQLVIELSREGKTQ